MVRRRVRSLLLVLPALFLFLLLPRAGQAQEGAISGTVTDMTGLGLSAVEVEVLRADGSVVAGEFSTTSGAFRITGVPTGTYTVQFTLPGWELVQEEGVTVLSGQTTSVSAGMAEQSFNLNPITVTTSRRVEKALDAPAAVEVVSREAIEARPTVTPVDHVKEQAGVDYVNTGLQSSYVVVRGFNNVFSGATLSLTDYRISRVPSLRVNISYFNPTTNSDLDRVEVVLGPGSALYGPNAANGVIHFLTQSPIDDPGVTLMVAPGLRKQGATESDGVPSSTEWTGQAEGRVAWANDAKTFGIKVSSSYFGGTEFVYNDPKEQEQSVIAGGCIQADYDISQDACVNFAGDLPRNPLTGGLTPDGQEDLETRVNNVAGGRDYDLKRWGFDVRTDFRPSDESSIILSGGRTQAINSVDLTGIGAGQVQDWGYSYVQGRFNWKRLFGQVFWNGNSNDNSYLLRSGRPLIDKSYQTVAQLQHGFDINPQHGLTYGLDFLYTNPQSDSTINGRHEEDDTVTEFGGYVQYDGRFSDKWNFVAAARLDDNSSLENLVFSPRAALVFKPTPERSIRASYNRAFSTPNTLNLFLDISAQPLPLGGPFSYDIRAQGTSLDGFTFNRSSDGVPEYMSPFTVTGLGPNGPIFDPRAFNVTNSENTWTTAQTAFGAIAGGKCQNPQTPDEVAECQAYVQAAQSFGQTAAPLDGVVPIRTAILNPDADTDREENPDPQFFPRFDPTGISDVPVLEPTIWQTFEVGYKGLLLGSKLLLGANVYFTDVDNFVSALEPFTPNVFLAGQELAGYLVSQGVPLDQAALIAGNVGSADTTDPESGTVNGYNGFPLGVMAPTTAGGKTGSPILLTYRNLGDFNYFGADASLTYILNDRWELGGTISWVQKDQFEAETENGGTRSVALNAPKWKGSIMLGYRAPQGGLSGAFRGRYVDGFPVASGVYTGSVEAYTVFDLNVGYMFRNNGFGVQLDITNIFDNDYQSFVGVPHFGRYTMLRFIYHTGF